MTLFERSERAPAKEIERLARRLRQLSAEVANPYAFTKVLGALLVSQTVDRFITKTGPDETRWRPWSSAYAARRGAADSLLVDESTHDPSGPHLKDSFSAEISAGAVNVTTAVPYAAVNQRTRPFIGLSRSNLSELEQAMQDVLARMVEQRPAKKVRRTK